MSPDASSHLALRLVRLSKRYPAGDQALSDVSLSVPPGQVLGLIGPSGAGKSTLIRCINRLVEPSSGQVFLGHARPRTSAPVEIELTGLGRHGLRRARRRIGMIFQEFALVERLTVMENVLSGRLGYAPFWRSWLRRFPAADIANAYRLLDRVGLAEHADKRADALSGGQRQRVGIARALAQEPDLLLVDEPTASLDPKTSRQIMRLLREVCVEAGQADDAGPGSGPGEGRGLAAIVNIHDVALAQQFMMRIVGLRAGRIVYDGPPQGLNPEVLTEIYGEEDWGSATEDAGHSGGAPERQAAVASQHHPGPEPPTDQSMAGAL